MFEFNPQGKRTILSIDGGGMRGVIPLKMLCYLEEQTGKPAYELFDMVAGTSTGAIISAGLGLGLSAKQILEIAYRDKLPKAFGSQRSNPAFWLNYLLSGLRFAYKIEPFLDALGDFARGKTIADLDKILVLMTTKDTRTSNTYFITNAGPGKKAFEKWPVLGAVAASSAAPIFFSPILGNLVDGGVGTHGNPCFAASIEAVEYISKEPEYHDFTPENILHISLGTGFVSTARGDGTAGRYWLGSWVNYLILESIDDAALQQVIATRTTYKNMDFRRYNPDLNRNNVEKVLNVKTGGKDPASFGLDTYRADEIQLMEDIGLAYAGLINWNNPAQNMPWYTKGGHPQPGIANVNWKGTIFE